MNQKNYIFTDETGWQENIKAQDITEAIEIAENITKNGNWEPEGGWIIGHIESEDGIEFERVTVWIEPNEKQLINNIGGNGNCSHTWSREGHGGCNENPGVFDIGGAIRTYEHCSKCGIIRITTSDYANKPGFVGNRDSVTFELPDPDWIPEEEEEEEI